MMVRKIISLGLCLLVLGGVFSGCGKQASSEKHKKVSIVTTIFPEYDWVMNIAKDRAEVTLLLDKGVDLHSYQPTAGDIMKISTCDLFIYVGGESDEWAEDALKGIVNKDMVAMNLLDLLGDRVKEEELTEGMEPEGDEEREADEHIWLSLKNARSICDAIAQTLSKLDEKNRDFYAQNARDYGEKLEELNQQYQQVVQNAPVKTLLFADRFPFRYLTDDYGLTYYAAFSGCSAETEASVNTIITLAKKVDELGLKTILTIESSDGSIANAVKNATKTKDQTILTMNSLQSETENGVEKGDTYLSLMEENLNVLEKALK